MTVISESGLLYKKNKLFLNSIDLLALCKKNKTPFYAYDLDEISRRVRVHKEAFSGKVDIHYAMKANSNLNVLESIRKEGAGVDVVSGGELETALEAKYKPSDIIFSGVGKSVDEISLALKKKIKLINVEGPQELDRIATLAKKNKTKAAIGIRFNPDVSPETHPYITTGFRENKFGMDESFLPLLHEKLNKYKKHISLQSISLHIGSQLKEFSSLKEAIVRTKSVFFSFLEDGHEMKYFDVGGGVGIDYFDNSAKPQTLFEYGRVVTESLADVPGQILCEPGRVLVGPAGVLIAQVEYIKTTHHKTFVILNTGMNHLIRPSLYEAYHRILPLKKNIRSYNSSYSSENLENLKNIVSIENLESLESIKSKESIGSIGSIGNIENFENVKDVENIEEIKCDVVGPICESGDFLARDRMLPPLEQGDFVAIGEAGAYGFSMANLYNLHALPKEVCVSKKQIVKNKPSRIRKKLFS